MENGGVWIALKSSPILLLMVIVVIAPITQMGQVNSYLKHWRGQQTWYIAGTFACANSYFYCENKYYIPAYIKFYSVNDDVCDEVYCKDSNESNGHIGCPNRCKDLGETYRMEKNFKKKRNKPWFEDKV